jgi:hypothetical protein
VIAPAPALNSQTKPSLAPTRAAGGVPDLREWAAVSAGRDGGERNSAGRIEEDAFTGARAASSHIGTLYPATAELYQRRDAPGLTPSAGAPPWCTSLSGLIRGTCRADKGATRQHKSVLRRHRVTGDGDKNGHPVALAPAGLR